MKSHPVFEKQRIYAPGPTPVPEEVLGILQRAPLHHRTKQFIEVLGRVHENLKFLFQTQQPVYVLTSSGTGAMEAAVVNLFATSDEVLVVNAGKFGERWGKMATRFGLKPHILNIDWGKAVTPEDISKALKQNPNIRGVLLQASETSTGVYHPVEEIARVVRAQSDALVIVDAITALGVTDLPMDKWGIDALVTGSQKALMLPPGLAFLSLSQRAGEHRKRANIPNFYFNLAAEDKAIVGGETAWTPAVSLISALDLVLIKMKEGGLPQLFDFHARLAEATRRAVKAMGLELFAKSSPSNAVTAVLVPSQIPDGKKIVSYMRDRFSITIAGGQDQWKGKIFRLAHLGFYDELDIMTSLSAIEMTLRHLGYPCELGKGPGAAAQYFMETQPK